MFEWFKRKPKVEPKVEPKKEKIIDPMVSFGDDGSAGSAKDAMDYIAENAIQRKAPVPKNPDGTAMDSGDLPGTAIYSPEYGRVNPLVLRYFVASDSFIGYHAMAIIAQNPLVQKACYMKVRDAAKKWYSLQFKADEVDTETIQEIEDIDRKLKLKHNVIEGCAFRNVFGIRHVLFKHTDPSFDYEQPFDPEGFKDGKYQGIAQIDPYHMSPVFENEDLSDTAAIHYYEPTYWYIQGRKYHRSHFVILYGDAIPDYLKPTYRYGGVSLTQNIYQRVYAAERSANEAPKILMTKRLVVRFMDMGAAFADKAKFTRTVEYFNKMRDNLSMYFAQRGDDFKQLDTNLSGFAETIMNQHGLVSHLAGIPQSRFYGTGHAGLGTGETDDDYYIQDLEELQSNDMEAIIMAHYDRLMPSLNLEVRPTIEWRPMKVMSDKEKAEAFNVLTQGLAGAYNTGAVDNIDIRKVLVEDKNSPFHGMEMPEEIKEQDNAMDSFAFDYVEEISKGKWGVYSESGELLGEHPTEEQANKQLKAIEANENG